MTNQIHVLNQCVIVFRSKTAVYLSTRLRVHFKSWFKFSSLTRCKNGPWSFWVFSSITLPIVIIIAVIAWGINILSITNIAMYVPSYTELTNGMNSVFQLHTFINFQQIFLFALFFSFFFSQNKITLDNAIETGETKLYKIEFETKIFLYIFNTHKNNTHICERNSNPTNGTETAYLSETPNFSWF